MYGNNIDPWEPGYGPERRTHNSEYNDYRNEYGNNRSPEYIEHRDIDHRDRDHRSPDYRSHRSRDRDRERERSRDRRDRSREDRDRSYRDRDDRYTSRQRDRGDSVERERDRDRDRDRDRERSRRDRDRDRERDRRGKRDDRDRDRDDEHGREQTDYEHDHRAYGSSLEGVHYKSQSPNNTIMIRGLAQHITENDVRQDILNCGLMPKDIRLIRKKDTGASRGFAFVEFNATQEAARWMEMKQGVLMLQDQYRALMQYSIPKDGHVDKPPTKNTQDWHCVKCGAHNFKRRETCFKCSASRAESEEGGEGSDEISSHPTNTVLLRGLDVLTTEDSVLQAMTNLSSMPIRSIRIGRDTLTNTSRGVCYLEMANVVDAMYLHTALTKQGLVVDGRNVEITYCKLHQVNSTSLWKPSDAQNHSYTLDDVAKLAEYSANLYAKTPAQKAHFLQYYTQYYQNQITQGSAITLPSMSQTDRVNAAAAVAQSAIQQLQASRKLGDSDETKGRSSTAASSSSTSGRVPSTDGKTYSVPDISTYHYDESSGYYYDPSTGLYYDPNSQYYYNSHTQQFLYWDADSMQYLPAKTSPTQIGPAVTPSTVVIGAEPTTNPNASQDLLKDDESKKKETKQDKVKVAKKIAKDMERWAKTLNQKKENAKSNWSSEYVGPDGQQGSGSGAADAGYAILEKKNLSTVYLDEEEQAKNNGLVAAYGGGSDTEEEIEDVQQEDKQHTDWIKIACLLCKRQFPSKEGLVRHQQLSELHKQNLEQWYKVRGLDPNDPQQRNNKYRDRAKERRAKYGEPEPPQPNKLKEKFLKTRVEEISVSYEEPTRAGIGSDNVGNKLLQKMGWSEGMGLGKSNQGRTSIIETERRVPTAGLGAKSSSYNALPGDTYKDCVKKMMYARYQELSDT
ncbi:RNA-binding protein 5-like [Leptopilina heterotoma]|uniref:RNA-binding protein 5-like n=1 Tax=Leptopilina heterotoma TaxID=63436 RepID=UPI001CA8AB9D|nr:RNA-binding protein 5-like [Leptopilina heterotoma]